MKRFLTLMLLCLLGLPSTATAQEWSRARLRYEVLNRSTFSNPSETTRATPLLNVADRDEWIAMDKAKHLAFSFLWAVSAQYAFENKANLDRGRALPASVASSAAIGLAKEVYDLRGPTHHFCGRDLVADAAGILLGVGLIIL